MKYAYTFIFLLIASVGFSQDFTWVNVGDTFIIDDIDSDVDFHSEFQNSSSSDITVRWRITSFTPTNPAPSDTNWDAYLCEEIICWPSWTIKPTNDVVVPANDVFQIYTHIQMLEDSGSASINICAFDISDSAGTYGCFTYFAMSDTVWVPIDTTTSVADVKAQKDGLKQNAPNPFKESTVIRYEDLNGSGMIRIHDLTGKIVDQVNLMGQSGAVTVGQGLDSGVYFYTLWDNGQAIDTKRMQVID